MTDKEIIIDGVDVAGCEYIDKDCLNCEILGEVCHEIFPNCYYKQLQYKTQECKKFRKANAEKNEFLQKLGISTTGEFHRINHYVDKLKQECEELKKANIELEDKFACEIQARLYHQNEWLKFFNEAKCYKQALEEIENFMIYELSGQNEWVKKSVLNIINEVKNA